MYSNFLFLFIYIFVTPRCIQIQQLVTESDLSNATKMLVHYNRFYQSIAFNWSIAFIVVCKLNVFLLFIFIVFTLFKLLIHMFGNFLLLFHFLTPNCPQIQRLVTYNDVGDASEMLGQFRDVVCASTRDNKLVWALMTEDVMDLELTIRQCLLGE